VTDDVETPSVEQLVPVVYVGSVSLFAGGGKLPSVGVGLNGPCDAYALVVPCEVNPLVPPTPLYAYQATDGVPISLPHTCLKTAVVKVDANGDGYTDVEAPALWIETC
jgi:hypothetical protein